MRRTDTETMAPILSTRQRMVPTSARASWVSASARAARVTRAPGCCAFAGDLLYCA